MASSTKNVKASAKDDLKQQEITQAVIIADNFDKKFYPLTYEKPAVLLPLVNVTLLDYVLHSLRECGIQEAYVFCCSHNQQIRSYVSSSKWSRDESPMSVVVISSASFMSMGDILRELDSKALIRNDFILIKGDVITTFPLCSILEEHRKRRQSDKSCALTLVYRNALPKHKTRCKEHDFLVVVESASKKIRYYQRINANKTVNVPLEVFQENEEITVHYDLLDTHISICSPCVPPLFSDNFDYQNLDDFVKGLIVNEELLGNSMYIHITQSGYGASISNLYMYDIVSQDILNRWAYPIVPDVVELNGSKYSYYRHNIYKQPGVEIGKNCILKQNVAIKGGTKIGENTVISHSVIGENCIIGNNVEIKGCYIWNNVQIGDGCKLETCLLADNVMIHKNVLIKPGCVIGSEVVISESVSVPACTKLQSREFNENDDFGEDDFPEETKAEDKPCDVKLVGENGHGYLYSLSNDSDEEDNDLIEDVWGKTDEENDLEDEETVDSSSSVILSPGGNLSEDSDGPADDYDEDATLFYSEVFESLQRGVEEKIKAENMILEINSSKHAYNVTMKEVNTLLIKAILKLPLNTGETLTAQQYLAATKKNLTFFQPLILNYIRSSESQLDCLSSVEDFMKNNDELAPAVTKVLHFWYESDVLNEPVILKWFNNLTDESDKIRKQAGAFINWLQEADEESD
ncbi:translation initiation factor eIF-2B subunit epsilon-like [Uloborus diversus]|uniref:translation initiation factor eIF-2B subunit epsilon-like n=1 Tax=Uloborus diversus TaxID=327109 RepID=UPI0024094B76|nr:translation initiation factor eIF-2B subunit epsilon-like [Uloborus diversus]